MGKFEILKNRAEQFYWRLKASNGEIIAVSEAYVSKQGCKDGIDAVKKYAATATVADLT